MGEIKKVNRKCFPSKDFSCENICYSLLKNINAQREGDWSACGFENNFAFIDYLNALEEKGMIRKKSIPYSREPNLANYIFIPNHLVSFDKKKKSVKWLRENVVVCISCVTGIASLFK